MTMTPEEIRSQQFRKAFRGIDPDEVSSFLERVAGDVESLLRDIEVQRERADALEGRIGVYQNIEKILQQTLLQGQETATRAVEQARKESELILQQAEIKSSDMLNDARKELTTIKEQITVLLAKKDYIISRIKMLLASQMETIKVLEGDPDMAANQPQAGREAGSGASELDDILKQID